MPRPPFLRGKALPFPPTSAATALGVRLPLLLLVLLAGSNNPLERCAVEPAAIALLFLLVQIVEQAAAVGNDGTNAAVDRTLRWLRWRDRQSTANIPTFLANINLALL